MPIYEFRCPGCGHEFERMQRLNDPMPPCPECGVEEARKKVSVTSFVLKGGGWYSDHYGLKSKPAGDGGGEAKAEAKPEAKGESKAEVKAEPKPVTPPSSAP